MIPRRRVVILAEGSFTPFDAKTAVGMLRYRPESVAAVLDSTRAGGTAQECVGVGGTIPVVATLEQAAAAGATALMIGIAPQGGRLPDPWRRHVIDALERGWDVHSGLHVFLGDDVELAAIARRSRATIRDVRRPPATLRVAAARAAGVRSRVVLTVGSDCNVGKMTAALEIESALLARGTDARFVATGQTGIFIAGSGVAVDAVPADFVAGAAETLVLEAANPTDGAPPDVLLVEGQGALNHPGYSGVTLALMHGAMPEALVLCHHAGRERMRIAEELRTEVPIPPLGVVREAVERAAAWVRPARVVAIALNTLGLDTDAAREACERAARDVGVPATDPVRFGAGPLAEALARALDLPRRRGGAALTTGTEAT